jgi:predicted enzyme involved in methoxymalonyl-ACP biosynthesis
MNIAVEQVRARGGQMLSARFVPTDRNGVIRDLFGTLGFQPLGGGAEGEQLWQLSVSAYEQRRTFIRRRTGRS